ncbi:MAG: GNAT family N-acetyltransferase [Patescibacteria group bacterium]|nr:GNAT family N-acetyltransferase [Patescibacteria group bacterium]
MPEIISVELHEPYAATTEQYQVAAKLFYSEIYELPLFDIESSVASLSRYHMAAAVRDGKVIGAAELLYNYPNTAFISRLAVDQWNRNEGVGSKLLSCIEQAAAMMGSESISCFPVNESAKLFFLKRKYRPDYSTDRDLIKRF